MLFKQRVILLIAVASLLVGSTAGVWLYHQYALLRQRANYQAAPESTAASKPATPAEAERKDSLVKEHEREQIIRDNTQADKVGIPASPTVEIFPALLEDIPAAQDYQPIELTELPAKTTENDFQRERETWYSKLLVEEYLRVGHRNPEWDERAVSFLKEAARRMAVRRYRVLRHDEFYQDVFATDAAKEGFDILSLGCEDPLVRAMLIDELYAQQRLDEGIVEARKLVANLKIDSLTELAQFQVIRPLLNWVDFREYREQATLHYRKSLSNANFDRMARRILYYEGQPIFEPGDRKSLPELILSLNVDETADPWLRNMIMADFYNELGGNDSVLGHYWNSYYGVLNDNPQTLRQVHMDHLRRAYLYYLQARRIEPELPESSLRLFKMSFDRIVAYHDPLSAPDNGMYLERLSQADPRFWFDSVLKIQFDFLPMYREYLSIINSRHNEIQGEEPFTRQLEFGEQCLATKRFDTAVPFLFFDSIKFVAQQQTNDASVGRYRNRPVFARPEITEPLKQMVSGYAEILTPEQARYFHTLQACNLWLLGDRPQALASFAAQKDGLSAAAFTETSLEPIGISRALAGREATPNLPLSSIVQDAVFTSDTDQLLVTTADGRIGFWDEQAGKLQEKYKVASPNFEPNSTVKLSQNGGFASVYLPPVLKILETATFSEAASLTVGDRVHKHFVSNTGRWLMLDNGASVDIWDLQQQKLHSSIPVVDSISSESDPDTHISTYAFSEDESLVAVSTKDVAGYTVVDPAVVETHSTITPNRVLVWDLNRQQMIYEGSPFTAIVSSLQFCDQGTGLLLAGTDWLDGESVTGALAEHHKIRIIGLPSGEVKAEFAAAGPLRSACEFGVQRSQIAAIEGPRVRLWDRASGNELASILAFSDQPALLTSDHRLSKLIAVDNQGAVERLDDQLKKGRDVISVLPDLCKSPYPVQLRIDSRQQLVGICDGVDGGKIWKLTESKSIGYSIRKSGDANSHGLAFSADMKRLAMTESIYARSLQKLKPEQVDKLIEIWNVATNQIERVLEGSTSTIECGSFSPNGSYFVAGLGDGNVAIWDLRSESTLPARVLREHAASVAALKFFADQQLLLTVSNSGESLGQSVPITVCLWHFGEELDQCEIVKQFPVIRPRERRTEIRGLDLSHDGKLVVVSDPRYTYAFNGDGESIFEVDGRLARFRPNSTEFITASQNAGETYFSIWNAEGNRLRTFPSGVHGTLSTLAFTDDGQSILGSAPSYGLAAWNFESGVRWLYISDLFKSKL